MTGRLAITWFLCFTVASTLAAQEPTPAESPNVAAPTEQEPTDTVPTEEPPSDAAEEQEDLPRAEDVPLPSAEELLAGPRRDWIVLQDGRLLVVEPVFPRPNTLEKIQAERNAILADLNRRASPEGKQRLDELLRLGVFVPDGEVSIEYRIRVDDIEEIVPHEELMLRRVDRLVDEGDIRKAFELLFVVARTDASWPGLDERRIRVTVADASRAIDAKDGERAVTFVESLYEREPPPDAAASLLARVADLLVGEPLAREDFRRARAGLARIRQVANEHPAVAAWTARLTELAQMLRSDAERASRAGDDAAAVALIEKAARTWPTLEGLKTVHARLARRRQRLAVGVPQVAFRSSALASLAEQRISRLIAADLFEIDGFEALPSFRSIYFEHWEPTDLGRRARFALKPTLPAWAARPAVTASETVRILSERMRAGAPTFDARFADLVQELRPLGPYEFEVVFSRVPLRTEAALARLPVFSGTPRTPGVFARFVEVERSAERVSYRRVVPERSNERHVAEIMEVEYPSYDKAAQALDRGDVRMLAEVPAWDVPRLRSDKRFTVTRLAVPVTCVLQFHPASEPLKSTELRRAFAASADAQGLLQRLTGDRGAEFGRLVTAPFPSTYRGYDPLVKPRNADLPLALALTLASEKRFGGTLPELIFAMPAQQPGRGVAEALAATWRRIGLPVRSVTFAELGPSDRWDVAYRELTIPDPTAALAPLITLDPAGDIARLGDLPEWLRQRLLDLERVGDATTAEAILIDLHRLLYADVRCVPLFEVDRFMAVRGIVEGIPERPVTVYQNVERWTALPDYPEETP